MESKQAIQNLPTKKSKTFSFCYRKELVGIQFLPGTKIFLIRVKIFFPSKFIKSVSKILAMS